MNGKLKIALGEVQKTLLYPLWGRARESQAENPLIRDVYAHEIVSKLDFDFSDIHNMPVHLQINSAVRAHNFDTELRKLITQYPDATIVNIGAGLDTTFQRVDNGRIFWYDLDLQDTIALRHQLVPEGERNRLIAKSVFDLSWFNDVQVRGSKVIFMAAGVLAYFTGHDIRKLFLDIAQEFPDSDIVFETYSRAMLWLSDLRGKIRDSNNDNDKIIGNICWTLNSSKIFTEWSDRISIVEEYPFYSRVNLSDHWDTRYLVPIRLITFLKGLHMVHLRFS
jgi:O-methyltransferase involved in polyketide biosynthesis